jgi:outer membrane protein assembly factor BamB
MKKIYFYLSFVLFSFSNFLIADDWTVGVGGRPERYGRSDEIGPSSAMIRWQGGLTSVFAQQAVIEGNIVVMSRTHNIGDVLHGTKIVAHNLNNGDTLWTKDLPVDFPSTDWRNRVSAIHDGKVYATRSGNTNQSYLYALDTQTGVILWKSQSLVNEHSTEGATFTSNGDLIIGNFMSLVRINANDGTTVWSVSRTCPTSDGCAAAVYEDKIYIWEASPFGPVVTAFNIDTGARLYSSEAIGGGLVQQVSLFVGPDGTIYTPRTQNNPTTDFLAALEDADTAFIEKWRVPLGYVPFASFGVGPDGTIYSYSRSFRVIRIDPVTGSVIDSSDVIESDFYQPRMAIDSVGKIYLTNGGFSQGRLYSFNPDLSLRWSEVINNVNIGGPALGENGTLVVCGTGTDVRAYSDFPVSISPRENEINSFLLEQNYPNPFNPITKIEYRIPNSEFVSLKVYDILGNEIATLVNEEKSAGEYEVEFSAKGGSASGGNAYDLPSGIYFYQLKAGGFIETKKMILMK